MHGAVVKLDDFLPRHRRQSNGHILGPVQRIFNRQFIPERIGIYGRVESSGNGLGCGGDIGGVIPVEVAPGLLR